jgi:phenylpropionate dioxygenase-like ring-hydroxylating dioxygenase large terminal subunit
MNQVSPRRRRPGAVLGAPLNAWYVAATAHQLGRKPLARTVMGRRMVLYRTTDGTPVALADRCVHRPVSLSGGRVVGDDIVAAYTGFRYAPDGRCVAVPTQPNVPIGAAVTAFPVSEQNGFLWVWPGEASQARLRPPPMARWLDDEPDWHTFGGELTTPASLRLHHDNFADITHVALIDPEIAPPALHAGTPPLQVQVSETTVSFRREFPPAPVARWHAELLGVTPEANHAHIEEGEFCSPGMWVDRWTVMTDAGDRYVFVFTHALSPITQTSTRHLWRVSRNFAPGSAAHATLAAMFERYYARVGAVLESMQHMVDTEGETPEVQVAADAAGSQVRKIMARLVRDEQTGPPR